MNDTTDSGAPDELTAWEERWETLHYAWVQVRYHGKRERFFDLADKLTKSATVVLGASLIGQYFSRYFPALASAITALGLLALIFDYGHRKEVHRQLLERAARLVASIQAMPVDQVNFESTAKWKAEYAEIEAVSPPTLKTLTLICEREQAITEGHPDHVPEQPRYRRLIAYII